MSQVWIDQLQGDGPFFGGAPSSLRVIVRTDADCQQVSISVRVTDASSPLLASATVFVSFQSTAPAQGLAVLQFSPPAGVTLKCGDTLYIEALCSGAGNAPDARTLPIMCKPDPNGGSGGGGGNGGGGGGPGGPSWPPMRCLFTAAAAAYAMLAGLESFAIGIGTQDAALLAAGTALLAAAGLSWALWKYWCGPSSCVRIGLLCYVFKMALLGALPVIAFSTSASIILVIVAYGSIAGVLVTRLRALHCPVPSARLPITQLPL